MVIIFSRWWLTIILLFLPFQFKIVESILVWNQGLASFLRKLDEITILIFLPFACLELYRKRELFDLKYILVAFSIVMIGIFGFISGFKNGNSLLITSMGVIEYVKYFLVIIIYAAFVRSLNDYQKVFRYLLIVTVFIGGMSFLQEIMALYCRYIYDPLLSDSGCLLCELCAGMSEKYGTSIWRLGIYRAYALISHYNVLGFYSLLILTIYLFSFKKINYMFFASLFAGVFLSVSRTVYICFVYIAGLQIFKGRRWLVLLLVPILILLVKMSFLSDFDIATEYGVFKGEGFKQEVSQSELFIQGNYRAYAFEKAIEVWKDNPFWGVGPGKFGSAPAIKYGSHLYGEYVFLGGVMRGLDQFWPQVLAETGIIGTGSFAGLLFAIVLILVNARAKTVSYKLRKIYTALTIYMAVFFVYAFNNTLISVEILFTYCALIGMSLGAEEAEKQEVKIANS